METKQYIDIATKILSGILSNPNTMTNSAQDIPNLVDRAIWLTDTLISKCASKPDTDTGELKHSLEVLDEIAKTLKMELHRQIEKTDQQHYGK